MVAGCDNIVYKLWKTKEVLGVKYDTLTSRQPVGKYKIVKKGIVKLAKKYGAWNNPTFPDFIQEKNT